MCMMMSDAANASKYQQIIEAAVGEFQDNGFMAASMDRVSARAGVSKRTVYKYFESKERLFNAIVEIFSQRLSNELNIRYAPGRCIAEQLTDLARAEGRLLLSPDVMCMARMLVSEVLRNPELASQSQQHMDQTAVFEAMFRDAAADGVLQVDDPRDAAVAFLGLLKARAFWPMIFGAPQIEAEEMERVIAESVEMMLRRYRPG